MAKTYGYARVSMESQDPDLQVRALVAAGVPKANIEVEQVSGAAPVKPKLVKLLERLKAGDTLAIWKIDRLGRSVLDALTTMKRLDDADVRIVITTLGADLKTPAGRLVIGMMLQIAEFERELIRERTMAGLEAAKARGETFGRPHRLTQHQREQAARMHLDEGKSLGEIASLLRCGRTIIHRAVAELKAARAVEA